MYFPVCNQLFNKFINLIYMFSYLFYIFSKHVFQLFNATFGNRSSKRRKVLFYFITVLFFYFWSFVVLGFVWTYVLIYGKWGASWWFLFVVVWVQQIINVIFLILWACSLGTKNIFFFFIKHGRFAAKLKIGDIGFYVQMLFLGRSFS